MEIVMLTLPVLDDEEEREKDSDIELVDDELPLSD